MLRTESETSNSGKKKSVLEKLKKVEKGGGEIGGRSAIANKIFLF